MFDGHICARTEGRPDTIWTAAEFVAALGEGLFDDMADAHAAGEVFRVTTTTVFEIFPVVCTGAAHAP